MPAMVPQVGRAGRFPGPGTRRVVRGDETPVSERMIGALRTRESAAGGTVELNFPP
ncbi:MAG TPA: hypothetical protein QGH28_07150 [Chloroflexota bacterium]|nr:hypothetical protein [Chloroflexota bacterium]